VLKDDTLGIGAKKGAQHDECTGLLGLQGLLGRLNGDEKQVEMVKKEEDRRKTEWISSKFGMRFVKGEVWKADDISKLREQMVQDNKAKEVEAMIKNEDESDYEISGEVTEEKDERKKGKKRRRSSTEDESSKKRKKSKAKAKAKRARREEFEDEMEARPKDKKPKRSKSTPTITSTTASGGEAESESKRRKKDKKERKAKEKRSRKDAKSKEKARKVASLDLENSSGSDREVSRSTTTGTSTLVAVTTGRNAVRARFIAAKRSAMMDAKSLNEVCLAVVVLDLCAKC
jgi:Pin2-interacting protein X1